MAEVGLLPFARIALQVSRAVLPRYRSRFSKRQFTQPQLLTILCLMRYEDWTFREAEVRLSEHRELRQVLGLVSVPDFTTLYRFLQRLDDQTIDRAVGETVRRLRGSLRQKRKRARVAVDATGLAQGAVSTFFVRRMHHHGQKPLPWRHWLKWVVAVDLDHQFVLSQLARRGPWNDCANLPTVIDTASKETRIGLVLADAEFDSERNHTYIRKRLGAQSVIPAKRGKKTWHLHGVRAEMRRAFPQRIYSRRSLIESLFSSVKRKLSARAPGRSLPMQMRQALLLGLSFNLYRLKHRRLFLRMSTEPNEPMNSSEPQIFEFGDFRVDAVKRRLLHRGEVVALTPKVFDTLLHLLQHNGRVVEKDELMRAIWPDTVVEENNLNQNISALRRVLGQDQNENRYILTIPGKGYRFVAEVQAVEPSHPPRTASPEQPAATIVVLGVLPFENIGADPEREYLADGLTEETIAALGQIDPDHLSVIGRTSVMAYKRTTKSLAEIGRELAAAYLVESSLRAEGGRLRITSKLIRVRDQVQIWSASYDSEPRSLLNFQRELSAAIAEQVHLRLSPERLSVLARRQTGNAEAYDLYLRGRHFWNQLSPPTTRRATEFFARATELDPEYALAWSGLADAYTASPINGDAPPLSVLPRAREAAEHAVRAESDLAEAQTSLGFVKFWFAWDWAAAESTFRKGIALDPSYSQAHRMLGIVLSHMRRPEEAALAMRRARELDPLLAGHQALSAQVAFAGRDYDAAQQFARQAIVVDPEFWVGYMQLAQALEPLGQNEQALEALASAGRFSGGNSKVVSLRGYIFAKLGRVSEAREVLRTLVAIARERYIPPYAMALVHAGLAEPDDSFEWLDRALEARDVHLAFLPIDPKWDALRPDPRFAALLKRSGIPSAPLPARSTA